ncbi:MAG: hydroxymethylglutaryl-CoA synthase [Chloroflexi bacterium RBG_16_57_9]|nr:MAG: hydroxymethylglutaryl-CoA synthase [Chloroflexi bacterium RBG_16_57_9]
MKPIRTVGIVGYGTYIPCYRIKLSEIERIWKGKTESGTEENAVPGLDEDVTTMAIEAAQNALARAGVNGSDVSAVWVGSGSKPYAVKPAATTVAEAIGAAPEVLSADFEFAFKAGTEAMQAAVALVSSGMARYALAIGSDVPQGAPGDDMEHNAASGAVAILIGPEEEAIALVEGSVSYATDTPDIFRRSRQRHLEQGDRFTGEPAYFRHTQEAGKRLLAELGRTPSDYQMVVFHQPNPRFPQRAAKTLGFNPAQLKTGMIVNRIGNPYAASSLLGLAACLEVAKPGDKIFLVSYGSGAGSDAFSFVATDQIAKRCDVCPSIEDYIARREEIDYATYVRYTGRLQE